MADKKTKDRQTRAAENREARRTLWMRIVLIGFSIMLILSLILSLAANS
jgi:hypothetical protein